MFPPGGIQFPPQQESRSVPCLHWEERSGKILIPPSPHPSQPTEDGTPTAHTRICSSTQETRLPRGPITRSTERWPQWRRSRLHLCQQHRRHLPGSRCLGDINMNTSEKRRTKRTTNHTCLLEASRLAYWCWTRACGGQWRPVGAHSSSEELGHATLEVLRPRTSAVHRHSVLRSEEHLDVVKIDACSPIMRSQLDQHVFKQVTKWSCPKQYSEHVEYPCVC